MRHEETIIPVKTREEVAIEYGITVKILNAQIIKYDLPIKPYASLFPKQQKIIYETLGYPPSVKRSLYDEV